MLQVFRPDVLRVTLLGALRGTGAHGGYYAIMTWLPTFLSKERHLPVLNTGGCLAVVIVAFWCGCMASTYLLDRIGRRRNIAPHTLFEHSANYTTERQLLDVWRPDPRERDIVLKRTPQALLRFAA